MGACKLFPASIHLRFTLEKAVEEVFDIGSNIFEEESYSQYSRDECL
jgi:hypothetical protein